jgi:hypothetical protein
MPKHGAKTCGPCTFCCKVMTVLELEKPGGQWCRHRVQGLGCGIYEARPGSCRGFECEWLADPSLPMKYRPDLSKVVLSDEVLQRRLMAHCDPANPLAWRREPVFSYLKQRAAQTWNSEVTVMAKAARRVWMITPTKAIDLGEIDGDAPLDITKFPDGDAKVVVLPTPETAEA